MDNILKLNQLIEAVLNDNVSGLSLISEEEQKQLKASEAIPAVPYPKLQLNAKWGRNPSGGLDVELFKLAGLAGEGTVRDRLQRLFDLVRCDEDTCPTDVNEIIARLSVMEMFSSMMTQFNASAKGFLFENFMALVLKGSQVAGTVIQDLEIMSGEETSATKRVSLKLLKEKGPIKGSIVNLHKSVMEDNEPVIYIIGYKMADGERVEIKYFTIDQEFFTSQQIADEGLTLQKIYQNYVESESKAKSQFYLNSGVVHNISSQNVIGYVPIYTSEQMIEKANELTNKLNQPIFEIYESLNLFSQLLTKLYIENDHNAGGQARDAFTRLSTAVSQEQKLNESSKQEGQTLFEMAGLDEEEMAAFESLTINEGIGGLISGMKQFYDNIKTWGEEKIISFLKKMGDAYVDLMRNLRKKRMIGKAKQRTEERAMKLLLTKKHIDLAIALFGAMFKLAGGYAIEALVKMPEIINKFSNILTQLRGGDVKAALQDLFGDLGDLKDIIKGALEYSKDVNSSGFKAFFGDYSEFGGLAESN